MLRTRWQKVLIDLWRNRSRTLIVALAIAVGVYAVGVVLNVRELVVREYESDQSGALRAAAIVRTHPFDDNLANRIAQIPGVAAAEGRATIRTRVLDDTGRRREFELYVFSDFERMTVDALTPMQGVWPPQKREVILERQALDYLGLHIGDEISVELDDGTVKSLLVAGTAHDPHRLSPSVTSTPTGYISLATMGSLGLAEAYTELHIRVAERADDEAHINAVVDGVEDQLNRSGRVVLSRRVSTESFADPFIRTIVLILSTFGVIILLLSSFLVVNAISALITQQIPQIGVMKLIGARRWQIMSLYVATVLVYGLLAIMVGIPAALLTSRFLMSLLVEGLLNVMSDSFAVPLQLIALQAGVGLLLPLVAGMAPVIKGTRVTTHKALNDVGMATDNYGSGWVEAALKGIQKLVTLQRPIVLAMRNTVRHKGRLVQTLVVLTFGTALFISVISVWASVNATVESFMQYHRYDVFATLERPYRQARLEQAALEVVGVEAAEGWSTGGAIRLRPNGTESDGMRIYAVPQDTKFMAAEVSAGAWLPGPGINSIVINSDVVDEEPDLHVGSQVTLEIDGREAEWRVVGVVPTEAEGPTIYLNLDDYAYISRTAGQVNRLQVITTRHDQDTQDAVESRLFEHLESLGFEVGGTKTTGLMRSENTLLFTVVVAFLVLMALLLAAVGGLGLTTTMSINMMERVREIGVLRAIGASNRSVRGIVLVEGIFMGVLSWIVGTLLSAPISAFMSEQLGLALIKVPLSYQYSVTAAVAWFFVLLGVAVAASLGPARNAVRLTVREVLAYE